MVTDCSGEQKKLGFVKSHLFPPSLYPHSHKEIKSHSIVHPIEETAENPSAVQAKIPIYGVCLLPRRNAEQERWMLLSDELLPSEVVQ